MHMVTDRPRLSRSQCTDVHRCSGKRRHMSSDVAVLGLLGYPTGGVTGPWIPGGRVGTKVPAFGGSDLLRVVDLTAG